jgi:hypothetical protein
LHWSASGHGWFARTEEVFIRASEQAYEHHLQAYLAARGMEWNTWSQIMGPAKAEWWQHCEATNAFRANLAYWQDCHDPDVQVWHPPSSREPVTQEGYPLRWSASGHGWFGKTDAGIVIFVPEAVYEERLLLYLARRGMELLTWTQIMNPAEARWRRQCEVLWTFWADLDYWQNCHDPDVLVIPREET